MIRIEFPSDRKDIALAIGQALLAISQGTELVRSPAPTTATAPEVKTLDEHAVEDLEKSQAPANDAGEQATTQGAGSAANSNGEVDEKGVAKNSQFCATAAKPFYASGKYKGQWKKGTSVSQEQYDAWYASELAKVTTAPTTSTEPEKTFDASQAWGANANTAPTVPTNGGMLFQWIAEQQNAGNITQQHVDQAYGINNLNAGLLFSATPDVQSQMCAALHATLMTMGAA